MRRRSFLNIGLVAGLSSSASDHQNEIAYRSVIDSIDSPHDAVVTVGRGGEVASINEAIKYAQNISRLASGESPGSVEIRLMSGFLMSEQVVVDRVDLGWITITSEDDVVYIAASALKSPQYNLYYPAFTASKGAALPVISALFSMTDDGDADKSRLSSRNGIFVVDGAFAFIAPGAGVMNARGRGLHVANASACVARGTNFSGASVCAVRNSNSLLEIRSANLQSSTIGLKLAGSGITDAEKSDVSYSSEKGIENYDSSLRFNRGLANHCTIAMESWGGNISAYGAKLNNSKDNGVTLRRGAVCNLTSSEICGAGGIALFASSASVSAANLAARFAAKEAVFGLGAIISVPDADLRDAGTYGVLATEGSNISAQRADTTGAGNMGFLNRDGSMINANEAKGTAGRKVNVLSRHGAIFRDQ